MGLTYIELRIANPADPEKVVKERLLIDSGAIYSVVQKALLGKLKIKPHSKQTFTLANHWC